MSHLFNNPDNGGQVHLAGIILRKPKIGNGGIGGGGKKNVREMKRSGRLAFSSKTSKRGNEQRLFKLVRMLVVQETHEATAIDVRYLRKLEPDHLWGRDSTGFEPLGAMLSPENIQLLTNEQHEAKTNALTAEGQRKDFRTTPVQEAMRNLTARIVKKLGPVWNLNDLKRVLETMLYDHGASCPYCGEIVGECQDEKEPEE